MLDDVATPDISKKWAYVLSRSEGTDSPWGWDEPVKTHHVDLMTMTLQQARERLRDWAIDTVRTLQPPSAAYRASLIELDDNGEYDLYFADHDEDIFWFHGVPHVALTV